MADAVTPAVKRITVNRCVVVAWHRPLCSDCGEPIETVRDAYAAWLVAPGPEHAFVDPEVIHCGGRCGHARRERQLPAGHFLNDLPVEWLRRAPLEAVSIAMRGTTDQHNHWLLWIAVVLGLPANAWNCLSALEMHGEVADVLVTRVPR